MPNIIIPDYISDKLIYCPHCAKLYARFDGHTIHLKRALPRNEQDSYILHIFLKHRVRSNYNILHDDIHQCSLCNRSFHLILTLQDSKDVIEGKLD